MLFKYGNIYKLFDDLYEYLLKISYMLNSDIRRDIFIGVTGLMVAIIIFIAEVISNKKYELEKRLILEKTKIIWNMGFCIFIYFIMFTSSIVKCSYDSTEEYFYVQNDTLFIILQLLINILILFFMYKTFNIFKISVKLNMDKEFFDKELDNYVYKRCLEIEKEANKKSLKNIGELKKDFLKYLNSKNNLSDDVLGMSINDELYTPIYANKRGIIKNYNYKKIDSMIDNINNISSNEESKDYLSTDKCVFIFAKQIGDKIEKNSIIGYGLNGYKQYFKNFPNCIIYDENSMYIGDEIKLINENFFEFASNFSEPGDFDENNKLFNYFNYLYQNKLDGVRRISIYQLEEMARKIHKDKYKNNKYVIFLNNVLSLSYSDGNYEEYRQISLLIYYLYYQQLKMDVIDEKKVAYNFSNNYFKFNYFSIKKNNDIRFYDELMSNLLRFICDLIRERKFDVITIIFKNILLEYDRHIVDDFDEKDILNLQFAIGIIQCLMMLVDKNNISSDEKKAIIGIINWTKQYFINTYDAWLIITNFKKYYNKKTSIQSVYDHLEFDFIDHEYLSSWSGCCIDEKIIIRELLYAFKISTVFDDNINYDEITKDDKYYFEELLKQISDSKDIKFEQILELKFSKDSLVKTLNKVIKDAKHKEKEYIKNNELNSEKVERFREIIKKEAVKENELEKYLNNLGKVQQSNIKLKRFCGINQLLPREIFLDSCGGYENIAKEFGGIFIDAKNKEFIKKINAISKESNECIDKAITNLSNPKEYLLITSYLNCNNIKNYDRTSGKVIIKDSELDILKVARVDSIYLIEKKYLPKLQYCYFDENISSNNVNESLFYDFTDCSANEEVRKEIIEHSSWLSEKGNLKEQHEFLKEKCRIRLYLSYRFCRIKNSFALKFDVQDNKSR